MAAYLRPRFTGTRQETVLALLLDGQSRLLEEKFIAEGTPTQATVYVCRVRWLQDFALWFGRIGGPNLPLPPDPKFLWKVFKKDYESRARSVFIAMSFRDDQMLRDVRAMNEAIEQFNADHPKASLAPIRVDEQKGASYEIPARVFQEIDQSSLMIAGLTDERPNVYCEVGYAKSRGIPFILTFHKKDSTTGPPWDRKDAQGNRVHFDLAAFRYVAYDNPLHLRDLLKNELDALFDQGGST